MWVVCVFCFVFFRGEWRPGRKEDNKTATTRRGDKIGMTLCIIKPLNDVRRKFSADHYAYW